MKKNIVMLSALCLLMSNQAVGMKTMKEHLVTKLRNKNTKQKEFVQVSHKLGYILASETATLLAKKDVFVETPCGTAKGIEIQDDKIVLIPIWRSGQGLLVPFQQFFPNARVGTIGLRRDEKSPQNSVCYLKEIPEINPDDKVIFLEPMIATGGSISKAIRIGKKEFYKKNKFNIKNKNIIVVCVIAAEVDSYKEGLKRLRKEYPGINIISAAIDTKLNKYKYIEPGLGDFGDRYKGGAPKPLNKMPDYEKFIGNQPFSKLNHF